MEWNGIDAYMHVCIHARFLIYNSDVWKHNDFLIPSFLLVLDTFLPFTMPRHSSACTVGSPTVFLALEVELLSNSDPAWHVTILRWRWRSFLCEPWNFGKMKQEMSERRDFGYEMMIYSGLYFVIIDLELNSTTFKVLAVVRGWHIAL